MLYRGLTDRHLSRLDEFEGDVSQVQRRGGGRQYRVKAFVYLMAPAFIDA